MRDLGFTRFCNDPELACCQYEKRYFSLQTENAKLRAALFEPSIETLASKVHDGWWEEKKLQGFHAPLECPYRTPTNLYGKFEAVCDQCHTDMYPYNELPENIKNYDRVTVKAVLIAIAELDEADHD